jgi:hypothetical protein
LGPAPTYNMPTFSAGLYQQSPGYNFELQGAIDALVNAGATKSGALSGNSLKAIQGYGTGLASQDYYKAYDRYAKNYYDQFVGNSSNYWKNIDESNIYDKNIYNWLYGLSSLGENAAATTGDLGAKAASTAGSDLIGAGTALAAGTLGATSAVTGTLNKLTDSSTSTGGLNSYISSLLYGGGGGTDSFGGFPAGGASY